MANQDTTPIEASYESAKQSIISYIGEVSRIYDLPILLINNLIYEIALESRNASFSAIVSGCDVTYPEQPIQESQPPKPTKPKTVTMKKEEAPKIQPQRPEPKTVTMKKEDALKEFKKMGIVTEEPSPSTSKSA